ncbi:MAG: hypothetical protein A2W00_03525 [Candidatus Eisenbacteria bacterium RBG_16_71_46]|nr:MAG: hypothetical protein A2W00_03525 [Candidatus Eisenbacteria bacterium RBG_16_71_46]OGF21839.1 MAG: hypothetical protein A2V63_13870 [Candidatus Eisenbacteria bacterium RBG_19FT_COMBO_70_11]
MNVLRKLVVTLALVIAVAVAAGAPSAHAARVHLGVITNSYADARQPGIGGNSGEPDVGQTATPIKTPEIGSRTHAGELRQPDRARSVLFAWRGWLWATRFPGIRL